MTAALIALPLYCERALAAAEPLNTWSNAGFLLVALLWLRRRPGLAATVAAVGFGSVWFHAAPSALSLWGDIVPIAAFIAGLLAIVLRQGLRWTIAATAAGVGGWLAVSAAAGYALGALGCRPAQAAITAYQALPAFCLNGGFAYLPTLAALVVVAISAHRRNAGAARALGVGAGVFALALGARTLDLSACPLGSAGGTVVTGHALWHLGMALAIWATIQGVERLRAAANADRPATRADGLRSRR